MNWLTLGGPMLNMVSCCLVLWILPLTPHNLSHNLRNQCNISLIVLEGPGYYEIWLASYYTHTYIYVMLILFGLGFFSLSTMVSSWDLIFFFFQTIESHSFFCISSISQRAWATSSSIHLLTDIWLFPRLHYCELQCYKYRVAGWSLACWFHFLWIYPQQWDSWVKW